MKQTLATLLACACLFCAAASAEAGDAKPADITMETTLGRIVIRLYDDKTPQTCANFRRYVKGKYYDGLIFHRVIPGFVIQGGGFEPGMQVRNPPHPPIKNEARADLPNKRGTLSMARTFMVDSATSQFFINLKDNPPLDHTGDNPAQFGYAVFGEVVSGMDVVDKIAAIPTGMNKGFRDVPTTDAVIVRAYEGDGGADVAKPTLQNVKMGH